MIEKEYRAIDIANYVVNYTIDIDQPISNLTLQKILYYIQAAFLVRRGRPAFNDKILKWRYGPIVKSVYDEYKIYVDKLICERSEKIEDLYYKEDEWGFYFVDYEPSKIINKKDLRIIEKVCLAKIKYDPFELVRKTHEEDPWIFTSDNNEIRQECIRKYFIINKERIYE